MDWPATLKGAHPRPLLDPLRPRMSEVRRQQFRQVLRGRFGEQAITNDHALLAYSYDATTERHRPDAVLLATSEADVADAIRMANQFDCPVIARGSGSNISGGTVPILGGLVISVAAMKRIIKTDLDNREVVVEPGLTNAELEAYLRLHNFFFPPDPASHKISSLGGNVGESSGGPHCVKYGVTSHYVRSLRGVLADGTIADFPIALDGDGPLDWSGLLTGSEGILAALTQLTLAVIPRPQQSSTMLAAFADLTSAVRGVSAIIAARIIPSTLELLDRASLEAVRPFIDAGYPETASAVLLIEVDGSADSLDPQMQRISAILKAQGASHLEQAHSDRQADQLMAARRAAYGAVARLGSHIWVQDVTVPRPRLAEMMEFVLEIRRQYNLPLASLAHAGDGNLHPLIPYNPDNREQWTRMKQADALILERAAQLGGSITGEHGIGVDKLDTLPLMFTTDELAMMTAVKMAWDPNNVLNPGKAVYPSPLSEATIEPMDPTPSPAWEPDSAGALEETVRWAIGQRQRFRIRGAGFRSPRVPKGSATIIVSGLNRVVDFDAENLTIEVEAGMTLANLSAVLDEKGLMFPGAGWLPDETIGGLISGVFDGPRRFGYGPLKNWVLGVTVLDGRGHRLSYGRKVVKNVAGLDMPKLFIGSLGQYGVIERAILRLLPRPDMGWLGTLSVDPSMADRVTALTRKLGRLGSRPTGLWMLSGSGIEGVGGGASAMHVLTEGWEAAALRTTLDRSAVEAGLPPFDWSDGQDTRKLLEDQALIIQRAWIEATCGKADVWAARFSVLDGRSLIRHLAESSTETLCYYAVGDGLWTEIGSPSQFVHPDPPPAVWRQLSTGGWRYSRDNHDNRHAGLDDVARRLQGLFDPQGLFRSDRLRPE